MQESGLHNAMDSREIYLYISCHGNLNSNKLSVVLCFYRFYLEFNRQKFIDEITRENIYNFNLFINIFYNV